MVKRFKKVLYGIFKKGKVLLEVDASGHSIISHQSLIQTKKKTELTLCS